ncbi:hypothetical protein MUP01_03660 [Candidatus Bathyarchaeota archaeon]|nr:hypothetical protein [Candidatus Bathyarchaeota archaeon]
MKRRNTVHSCVSAAAAAFGSYPSHSRWNPFADDNEDNRIDIRDVSLIARDYGKVYG